MFKMIAFDADDTLWHNERYFAMTQKDFQRLLKPYHDEKWVADRLYETEMKNLKLFGYGIKGFALSMIETAVELTEGRIKGGEIQYLIDAAKSMLQEPIDFLQGVEDTLAELCKTHPLMIITKGDLFDQESKIARSGAEDYFRHVEIVSEKNPASYARILERYQLQPEQFLMVGNSLKSDIFPVLDLGGHAVHIPYDITWKHELVAKDRHFGKYRILKRMDQLPDLVSSWVA